MCQAGSDKGDRGEKAALNGNLTSFLPSSYSYSHSESLRLCPGTEEVDSSAGWPSAVPVKAIRSNFQVHERYAMAKKRYLVDRFDRSTYGLIQVVIENALTVLVPEYGLGPRADDHPSVKVDYVNVTRLKRSTTLTVRPDVTYRASPCASWTANSQTHRRFKKHLGPDFWEPSFSL